ncbi:Disease resistance protein RPM1 [Ananas comosus]|nr:Disease resistance protein RPM1 [Ananas comosus]CAD1830901.1 unnamed protein product [Ananas comosus var. bracteatus]
MEGALVSYATGTAKAVLPKLAGLLEEEVRLLKGLRGEIQFMKDELESMTAFLIHLSEKRDYDTKKVRTWIKQVRELSYDIEDCIDKFKYRVDAPGRMRSFVRSLLSNCTPTPRMVTARHFIATEIQLLKIRTRDVNERRARY